MATIITSMAVSNHCEPEPVCFLCRRIYKTLNDESKQPIEKSDKQHFQKLFQCCAKYQWPNSLNKYFQFNYEIENLLELCADCLLSLEKLFEMNELLEEMLDGIKNFIGDFSKDVLDYQNQSELEKETPQFEEVTEVGHLENTGLKHPSDIAQIEVDLDYIKCFSFEMEDVEEYATVGEYRDEPLTKTSHELTRFKNNSATLPLPINFLETNIKAQEQILVAKYNASDLGVLYQLKPLRIILKRLEVTNGEKEIISNRHENQNTIFECEICQTKFHEKIVLIRHLSTHKCNDSIGIQNLLGVTDENVLNLQEENREAAKSTQDGLEKFIELENEGVDIHADQQSESEYNNTENRTPDMVSEISYTNIFATIQPEPQSENSISDLASDFEKSNTDIPAINQIESYSENRTSDFILSNISENDKQNVDDMPLELEHTPQNDTTSSMTFTANICQEELHKRIPSIDEKHHQYQVVKRFKCISCKFSCNFAKQLLVHSEETGHVNVKTFTPNYTTCIQPSPTKHHLHVPQPIHTESCGEVLRNRTNGVVNDQNCFVKLTFECKICQKIIDKTDGHSLKSLLQNHRHAIHKNENCYECEICGYFFKENEELQIHKNIYNNETEVYQCKLCYENFHTKFDLDIHHKCVSDCESTYKKKVHFSFAEIKSKSSNYVISYDRELLQCKICHILVEPEKMYSHFNTHPPYKCHICGSTFISTHKLSYHKSLAHSDKLPHKCSLCDLAFKTSADQTKHEKEKHSSKKAYSCDFCGKLLVFASRTQFLKHQRAHFIVAYNCQSCDKTYKSRNAFLNHQRNDHFIGNKYNMQSESCPNKFKYDRVRDLLKHKLIHSFDMKHQYQVAKRFKCTTCKFSCNFAKQLLAHSAKTGHVNEKTFKCNPCARTFHTLVDFNNHLLKVHKIFKCLKCSKIFLQRKSLIEHVKLVHRSQLNFKCEICEKQFLHKTNLARHSVLHQSKFSSYKCTICNETFQFKILSDEHNIAHDNGNCKCTICGEEFRTKHFLYRHFLIHRKIQDKKLKRHHMLLLKIGHKCRICRKSFSTRNRLNTHHFEHKKFWEEIIRKRTNCTSTDKTYLSKLTSLNLFECQICQEIFTKSAGLSLKASVKIHRQTKHKTENCYECKICGYFFKGSKELQDHKNLYSDEPKVYKCEFCYENFHTKCDFDSHHKYSSNCHLKEGDYELYKDGVHRNFVTINSEKDKHFTSCNSDLVKCKICDSLIKPENIFAHFKSHLPCTCHICGLTFKSKKMLKFHEIHVHSVKLPYKCSICNLSFTTAIKLKTHEKEKHSSDKTLECDFCGKVFSCTLKSYFLQHQRTHFIKFTCELCDISFKLRETLVDHQKNVHYTDENKNESKNVNKFQCEYCSKKFRDSYTLRRHITTHTGEMPFKCTKCEKGFKTKSGLNSHSAVHTEFTDKSVQCKFCGKLTKKDLLSDHYSRAKMKKRYKLNTGENRCD